MYIAVVMYNDAVLMAENDHMLGMTMGAFVKRVWMR